MEEHPQQRSLTLTSTDRHVSAHEHMHTHFAPPHTQIDF